MKFAYRARSAERFARERLVQSRHDIDAARKEAERMLAIIREGLARGLSPAQIAVVRGDVLKRSVSTIYRWVEVGYGDLCNLDLRKKASYKKRKTLLETLGSAWVRARLCRFPGPGRAHPRGSLGDGHGDGSKYDRPVC